MCRRSCVCSWKCYSRNWIYQVFVVQTVNLHWTLLIWPAHHQRSVQKPKEGQWTNIRMSAVFRSALCLPNWASQALKSGQGKRSGTANARFTIPKRTIRPSLFLMRSSSVSLAASRLGRNRPRDENQGDRIFRSCISSWTLKRVKEILRNQIRQIQMKTLTRHAGLG